jgi:hypothetical protein
MCTVSKFILNIITRLWAGTCKLLRDLALTLYDHPSEFKCLSLSRLWATVFGIMIFETWRMEVYHGVKFTNWMYLSMNFSAALGAYGLKKWKEGGERLGTSDIDGRIPNGRSGQE